MQDPTQTEYKFYYRPFESVDAELLLYADTNALTVWKNRRRFPGRLLMQNREDGGEMIDIRADWPEGQLPAEPPLICVEVASYRTVSGTLYVRYGRLIEHFSLFGRPSVVVDLLAQAVTTLAAWSAEWTDTFQPGDIPKGWTRLQPYLPPAFLETLWPGVLGYLAEHPA